MMTKNGGKRTNFFFFGERSSERRLELSKATFHPSPKLGRSLPSSSNYTKKAKKTTNYAKNLPKLLKPQTELKPSEATASSVRETFRRDVMVIVVVPNPRHDLLMSES
jgi:hypothetical protein